MNAPHPHIHPVSFYVKVFLALIVFTFLTVLANGIELGRWNTIVALAIAICKALLVILFFMHVKESTPLTKLFVGAGFFWLAIMIVYTMGDYLSRDWLPYPTTFEQPANRPGS